MSDKYQAMRDACTAYIQPKGNMESREHSVIRSFKTRLEWENVCHPWAILELLDEIATLKATASQESAPGQEAVAPIGYIDRLQLERWERLRGTEFEVQERAYIGFSTKPFTSEMTDCTLAVYLTPPTSTAIAAMVIKEAAEACRGRARTLPAMAAVEAEKCAHTVLALSPANAESELEALMMKVATAVAEESRGGIKADDYTLMLLRPIVRRVLDEKGE
jgi:hypothetical protein